MKATGIVRRIDDLGRIVIPKEIRRTLRIKESDSMEIFTDGNNNVILKKYSPMGEFIDFAKIYAESLMQVLDNIIVCITDKEQIIAVAGGLKKDLLDKEISPSLEKCINARDKINASESEKDENFILIADGQTKNLYSYELIVPIISDGEVFGSVIFLSQGKKMGDYENKLINMAAFFLGKQIGQ